MNLEIDLIASLNMDKSDARSRLSIQIEILIRQLA